jgi:hypothetical protein
MEPFPYNLPIFRRWHEAASPNGRLVASISASEVSMSNPTSGTLRLSDGLQIDCCNPAFIWSDDSRFLAVPQWRYFLGLQLRQRLLVIDSAERSVFGSKPLAWILQPRSFERGSLTVEGEPASRAPKEFVWRLPEELPRMITVTAAW